MLSFLVVIMGSHSPLQLDHGTLGPMVGYSNVEAGSDQPATLEAAAPGTTMVSVIYSMGYLENRIISLLSSSAA